VAQIHQLADTDTNDQACGGSRSDPARGVRRSRGQGLRKLRKRDHARGPLCRFESTENLRVLSGKPLGRERFVCFRRGVGLERGEPGGQFGESRPACRTALEVRVLLSNP
jgi:hypothetical protein